MTEIIKAYVVENDPITLLWMKNNLSEFPDVEVCGFATTKEEAIEGIQKTEPDLLLMDIELDDCTSFEVLEELNPAHDFGLVFFTSHEEYALKAIKVNAIDYLSKPVEVQDLRNAVNTFITNRAQKLGQLKKLLSYLETNKGKKRIAIPLQGYTELVDVDDIIYFKADVNYSYIYIKDLKPILVSKTLKEFDTHLSDNETFFRMHQSYLINTDHIKKIIKTKLPQVVMSNDTTLTVSRSKKAEFLAKVLGY